VRALVQRVTEAVVRVDGQIVGQIERGLCVFVGVTHDDTTDQARALAAKVWHLRVFDDAVGMMNRSAADTAGQVMIVSQFTLYGSTAKGRRPTYVAAAPGLVAEPLIDEVVRELRVLGAKVATGRFGADMAVSLVNDGPVTLWVEL